MMDDEKRTVELELVMHFSFTLIWRSWIQAIGACPPGLEPRQRYYQGIPLVHCTADVSTLRGISWEYYEVLVAMMTLVELRVVEWYESPPPPRGPFESLGNRNAPAQRVVRRTTLCVTGTSVGSRNMLCRRGK